MATSVTMLARPSFTPGMGTTGGIWLSATNIVSATAASTAHSAMRSTTSPLPLRLHYVYHQLVRDAGYGDKASGYGALPYADLVGAIRADHLYAAVLHADTVGAELAGHVELDTARPRCRARSPLKSRRAATRAPRPPLSRPWSAAGKRPLRRLWRRPRTI